jgi:nucleoid-associated protein YgaU
MSHPNEPRDAVRRNAQSHFTHTERRDELVRQEIEKERAATDAKTAKLRAMRLAKEASDRAEAEKLAAERGKAAPKTTARRKRASTA